MNLTRFEKLYNLVPTDRAFTMDDMADFAVIRFRESIEENKYFYYGPFTGLVARSASFCFVGRLLANHSDGHAGGTLSKWSSIILRRLGGADVDKLTVF